MDKTARISNFIFEVQALCEKHKFELWACGCCEGINLLDCAETDTDGNGKKTVANDIIFELGKSPEFHVETEGYKWQEKK